MAEEPTPLRPELADDDEYDRRQQTRAAEAEPVYVDNQLRGVIADGRFYPVPVKASAPRQPTPDLSPDVPEFEAHVHDQLFRELQQGVVTTVAGIEALRVATNAQIDTSYHGVRFGAVRREWAKHKTGLALRGDMHDVVITGSSRLVAMEKSRSRAVANAMQVRAQLQDYSGRAFLARAEEQVAKLESAAFFAGREMAITRADDMYRVDAREAELEARLPLTAETIRHEHDLAMVKAQGKVEAKLKKLELKLAMQERQLEREDKTAERDQTAVQGALNMIPQINDCLVQLQRAAKENPTEQVVAALDLLKVAMEKGGELMSATTAGEQQRLLPMVQDIFKRAVSEGLRALQ